VTELGPRARGYIAIPRTARVGHPPSGQSGLAGLDIKHPGQVLRDVAHSGRGRSRAHRERPRKPRYGDRRSRRRSGAPSLVSQATHCCSVMSDRPTRTSSTRSRQRTSGTSRWPSTRMSCVRSSPTSIRCCRCRKRLRSRPTMRRRCSAGVRGPAQPVVRGRTDGRRHVRRCRSAHAADGGRRGGEPVTARNACRSDGCIARGPGSPSWPRCASCRPIEAAQRPSD